MGRRVPWLAVAGAAGAILVTALAPLLEPLSRLLPACPFKALTGIPCATCGLTRSVLALSRGQWSAAFHWHPVAVLLAASWPPVAAWDLWRAWRGRPYPRLPDHWAPRALAGGILLGTWAMQVLRGM